MSDLNAKISEAIAAYFLHFNAGNAEAIAALYAEDAVVEDPVGSEPKRGRIAILDFYRLAVKNGARLVPEGEVRIVGHEAAFAFCVHIGRLPAADKAVDVDLPQGGMEIRVIDAMNFNDVGEIVLMRAFWGPGNIHQL